MNRCDGKTFGFRAESSDLIGLIIVDIALAHVPPLVTGSPKVANVCKIEAYRAPKVSQNSLDLNREVASLLRFTRSYS